MEKYSTVKNPALKDAFNKASQQSPYVKNLVQEAKQNQTAKRYIQKAKDAKHRDMVNAKLNDLARECMQRDIERHANELNPSQAKEKEKMLNRIMDLVAIRDRWIYDSTDNLGLACWKDSYLIHTHETNAFQQSYRLAKMIFETAITQSENPLFDASMKNLKRDIWDLLVLDCNGNEHNALVTGCIIADVAYKAWLPNGIELPQQKGGKLCI